jgi:hypothetical protein
MNHLGPVIENGAGFFDEFSKLIAKIVKLALLTIDNSVNL